MTNQQKLALVCDINFEIQCGVNSLSAVYTAMVEGPFAADEFMDALYFTLLSLDEKQKKLQNLLNE